MIMVSNYKMAECIGLFSLSLCNYNITGHKNIQSINVSKNRLFNIPSVILALLGNPRMQNRGNREIHVAK